MLQKSNTRSPIVAFLQHILRYSIARITGETISLNIGLVSHSYLKEARDRGRRGLPVRPVFGYVDGRGLPIAVRNATQITVTMITDRPFGTITVQPTLA